MNAPKPRRVELSPEHREALQRNIDKEGFDAFFLEYTGPAYWQDVHRRGKQPLPPELDAAWRAFIDARLELARLLAAHGVTVPS